MAVVAHNFDVEETARLLLRSARTSPHGVFRENRGDGTTIVASTIEKSFVDSQKLFVQVLPAPIASNVTSDERRKKLEAVLLGENPRLAMSMSGDIGALKNRIEGKVPAEVEQDFWERYAATLADTPLKLGCRARTCPTQNQPVVLMVHENDQGRPRCRIGSVYRFEPENCSSKASAATRL